MFNQRQYSQIRHRDDEQQLIALMSQCFGELLINSGTYFHRLGQENFRILHQNDQVIAGLGIYPMAQWYGGQAVPMAGIAAVGVIPEFRGQGLAATLLNQTLQELYQLEYPLSVLYPATQILYRKVGYEQGGSYCLWELPTASIQVSQSHLPMSPVSAANYESFQNIYQQKAKANNGHLDRNLAIWQKTLELPNDQELYAYLLGEITQPEGYLVFTQQKSTNGLCLNIKDWALLTPQAIQRFWSFLADHRSMIRQIQWFSSPIDPIMLLLPEQTPQIKSHKSWMLRIVNVPLALSKRGYPIGVDGELHLEITDPAIAPNNGHFRLQVSQGQGQVTPGGTGDFQLDIRGLASLYTGLFTPTQLQRVGYLRATPEALQTATSIFSGATPWMPDFF